MITQQTQIKINLPVALKEFVQSKAQRFGIPLATYLKHLILKDVEEMQYPVYPASKRTERLARKALKEKDKAVKIENIDEFFKNL